MCSVRPCISSASLKNTQRQPGSKTLFHFIYEALVHACVGFFGCVSCLSDWQLHKAIIGWCPRSHKLLPSYVNGSQTLSLSPLIRFCVFFSSLASDVPSKWMDRTQTNWNLAIWDHFCGEIQTVFACCCVFASTSWVYADSFFLEVYINWYGNSECEVKLVTPCKTLLFSYFSIVIALCAYVFVCERKFYCHYRERSATPPSLIL